MKIYPITQEKMAKRNLESLSKTCKEPIYISEIKLGERLVLMVYKESEKHIIENYQKKEIYATIT